MLKRPHTLLRKICRSPSLGLDNLINLDKDSATYYSIRLMSRVEKEKKHERVIELFMMEADGEIDKVETEMVGSTAKVKSHLLNVIESIERAKIAFERFLHDPIQALEIIYKKGEGLKREEKLNAAKT